MKYWTFVDLTDYEAGDSSFEAAIENLSWWTLTFLVTTLDIIKIVNEDIVIMMIIS